MSFFTDIKILLLTILKVFKRDGINQEGVSHPEPFKGMKLINMSKIPNVVAL